MKLRVSPDNTVHDAPDQPLTIVCHQGAVDVHVEDEAGLPAAVVLSIQETTYHARRLSDGGWHEYTEAVVKHLLDERRPLRAIRPWSSGTEHLVGLVDLSLKLNDMGVPVHWKFPESCLHPKTAAQLGDLAAYFVARHNHDRGLRLPGGPPRPPGC